MATTIDSTRLWNSLMEMAKIGATENGGCCRLALTDLDRQGRDLFIEWARDAGCSVEFDDMGNIFARRAGTEPDRLPIATGSHLDTQPTGGKFDGVYGVLAGWEVIRTLNDADIRTEAPVEVCVWTNEEGARFAPSMIGSGVFAGAFNIEFAHAVTDEDGVTLKDALIDTGYLGAAPCGDHPMGAFFEAHIEQGPVLEAEEKTIGVVTGGQGMGWYNVTVTGAEGHAGTTPMGRRQDALAAAVRMMGEIEAMASSFDNLAVATIGHMRVHPNSRNTIPGRVLFTVDLRHPEDDGLADLEARFHDICNTTAEDRRLSVDIERVSYEKPVVFDAECVDAVRRAAEKAGYPQRDIVSGAGQDACFLCEKVATAMIFVPCAEGLSHNEAESADEADLAAGAQVLLGAILERAGIA